MYGRERKLKMVLESNLHKFMNFLVFENKWITETDVILQY